MLDRGYTGQNRPGDRGAANRGGYVFQNSGNEPDRTVEAGRRRKPDAAPPGGRERAETPRRREEPGGGGSGTSGGSGGTGQRSGSSLFGGKGCLSVVAIIAVIAIYFGMQYFGGSETGDGTTQPLATQPVVTQPGATQPVPTPAVGTAGGQLDGLPPAASFATNYANPVTTNTKSGQTWLVMLYDDADDKVLEKDIYMDLNEAEKAGASDRVKVVAQIDRYAGAYSGDGNWTETRRYVLSQDDNLGKLVSQSVDLGEINMSAGQSLIDFATWAVKTYPSDKYVLILSDHGMGWPGGWSDPTPKGSVDSSIPMEARLGDLLYLNEMDNALSQIRTNTGMAKFELIGLDACLMGQLEVFTTLEPHARYAVASEEVEPALGWAYTDFLKSLIQNPDMDGAQLGKLIVESYIEEDQTLLDYNARLDFLGQGSPLGALFGQPSNTSSQQLARELGQSSTLTAVDLGNIGILNSSLNKLAYNFQKGNQQIMASARGYAQSFTSIFGSEVPASYIDLGNFVQIIKQKTGTGEITAAADGVLSALKQVVIAEKHGAQKPGATGVAIYFPNSQLYQNAVTGAQSYTAIANRFAARSLWDDFLAYHYSGQKFTESDAKAAVPASGAVRAPAAGAITISNLTAIPTQIVPGQPVTLSANISGANIGHIYLFVGYYDRSANSILVADHDYLESSEIREVDGVYYPDWGQGDFKLKFDWEPVVFAVSDGKISVPALFRPEDYGRSSEEAIYAVDGVYTIASGNEQLNARIYFINGVMRQVVTFTGESDASAPREISPVAGDKFTIMEKWLDLDSQGQVSGTAYQEGKTLTFGSQMFTWETLDAAAGEYAVGFIVADLDGQEQEALTAITVQ